MLAHPDSPCVIVYPRGATLFWPGDRADFTRVLVSAVPRKAFTHHPPPTPGEAAGTILAPHDRLARHLLHEFFATVLTVRTDEPGALPGHRPTTTEGVRQ